MITQIAVTIYVGTILLASLIQQINIAAEDGGAWPWIVLASNAAIATYACVACWGFTGAWSRNRAIVAALYRLRYASERLRAAPR